MYDTVSGKDVKILAKRTTGILCVLRGRTLATPLEALWDDGDQLIPGQVCEIQVWGSWARANGVDDE